MKLCENIIKAPLYPNTWILYNNERKQIIRVNDKTVVIETDKGEERIAKTEVESSVIKYTVKVEKRIFDLIYSDYHKAIKRENGEFVEGYTTQIKTRSKVGDTVRIDDLSAVDKFQLYNPEERFAIIIDQQGPNAVLELTRKEKGSIRLHRTKYVLVNEKDTKIFFKLK